MTSALVRPLAKARHPSVFEDALRVGSKWWTLRLEVGTDNSHGVRQPLHAEIVGVRIATPRYGRKRHVYLAVRRLDGPVAGTVTEWTVDEFVNLWMAD